MDFKIIYKRVYNLVKIFYLDRTRNDSDKK